TLADGSALPNFHFAGYFAGQQVRIAGTGTADDGTYTIVAVTPTALTLAGAAPVAGTFNGATIDGLNLITIDGRPVGVLTGATASTLTISVTNPTTFGAVDPTRLHVVSVSYYGNYDGIVIGDLGTIVQDVSGPRDTTKPLPALPQEIQTTQRVRTIQTVQPDNFANDTIYGSGGDNILIGGGGNDLISGGLGRDLIFGEDVLLDRSASVTPYAGCAAQLNCFVSPLFEDLSSTQVYSTSIATEGQLLTDGLPQLDPRGHASWADYRITQLGMDPTEVDASAYEGSNYIAGGGGHDMIFGGLGNDTIQAGSSIDFISHPYVTGGQGGTSNAYGYASSCTSGGHPGAATLLQRVGACRDANNALLINPSVSRGTDAGSYIEGGGGSNVIFGDGGQNDIIGGNSDFFGTGTPATRTSGSNTIFGGSGTLLDRAGKGDTSTQGHDTNADVVTANNAEIVRLVGTDGKYGVGDGGVQVAETGFLRYNYDNYSDTLPLTQQAHIVVRGVTLLDNTPGGPDLARQLPGPQVTGAKATNGVGDIGGTPETIDGVNLMKGSEIHGEAGDAFIYGGPANDVIFGGGQNDTIITSYGDNWVSGGRGDACIIGGGGRCFISRNGLGEPLYGVVAITSSTTPSLNQLITTPGNVQQAVINVAGALNYAPELFPYNWDPNTWAAPGISNGNPTFSTNCKENQPCPTYSPAFGHNIIYGGFGNGVVHGGPGNSAISGAEAPVKGYTDNFNMYGKDTAAQFLADGTMDTVLTDYVINKAPYETDFYHPFNPGNPAGFMPNGDPPNGNAGRSFNIGKSLYFNAEDPRRQIQLWPGAGAFDPNVAASGDGLMPTTGFNPLDCEWTGMLGTNCTDAGAPGLPFFMTFDQSDPAMPIDQVWNKAAHFLPDPVTGDKALFGDLGNDYIVSGMGRVRVYGGWGGDLIDLRASTVVDGALNDMPVPNSHGTAGSPAWEALAFGGAGQDILFAGTGGDRLIDWVGNHNSFYVPFSQFGMPAVSRTLMPFLPEFLYALSKSDGADQLLGPRADAFCASTQGSMNPACSDFPRYSGTAARNGEPFGELGLVLQHDAAWHQQSGPPFNEMPENLGGVGNDVAKTANVLPFASPGTCDAGESTSCTAASNLSVPNGAGANLPSGTNTPGASAVPLVVSGTPGATVSFTVALGTTYKITGGGVIGATGKFGTSVDVSGFPDGLITVTAVLTANGTSTTVSGLLGKNSVAPPAPTVSAAYYANEFTVSTYNVTVTGQPGSIANVVISDGLPVADQSNGMDFVGTTGSVVVPVDVTALIDGPMSISVSLTNGAGNSFATTLPAVKDTVPPPLAVSAAPYVNIANASAYQPVFTGEGDGTVSYSMTDGTTTLTGNKFFNGSTKWQPNIKASSFKDGPLTLTVTETDPAGNPTVVVVNLVKDTVAPSGSFAVAGATINGVVAVNNPALSITPSFAAPTGIGSVLYSINGGTPQTNATLSSVDGLYTVTALVTSNAGNSASFSKSVRLDRSGPAITTSITAPTNAGSYDVGQAVTLTYSGSDPDNVTAIGAVLDGSRSITSGVAFNTETLTPGTHTFVITATDGVGNVSTATLTITVHATVAGLTTAVNDGAGSGKITSSALAAQLRGYLSSAQAALTANNHTSAKTYLGSFVAAVNGAGTSINAGYAALLVAWANDLISRL
ncbi:MAG TPA: hypothetical protein VGX27_04320, partial [Candidatus Dormibacteraeota bacterium]|nr:hypothetical protein [Candidatus Dormibacteraeota bacterium]